MALEGIEWLIVIAIVGGIFLWSPHQLPKLARSLGEAKRELQKALKND